MSLSDGTWIVKKNDAFVQLTCSAVNMLVFLLNVTGSDRERWTLKILVAKPQLVGDWGASCCTSIFLKVGLKGLALFPSKPVAF